MAETQGEDAQAVREYVDYRNPDPYKMLGEATQEEPPFDELLVTDATLLGDTEDEVKKSSRSSRKSGSASEWRTAPQNLRREPGRSRNRQPHRERIRP